MGVRLLLASASPRRAELLHAAGIDFDVTAANVDESIREGESPASHIRRLAEEKVRTVLPLAAGRAVLGADTIVVVDDLILGKPADAADARRMLRRLSGRSHQVMTGVCLAYQPSGITRTPGTPSLAPWMVQVEVASTAVEFAQLSDQEITDYIGSGEPVDKAGAYAIQGRASRFASRIEGSYSNVVGLPVALVYDLCKRAGLLVS